MATLRKANCYRGLTRAYTRKSKFKKHSFIPTVPEHKIVKFNIGDSKRDFEYAVRLITKEELNIRHNAIESVRQVINRTLQKKLGVTEYFFHINAYPHHVLRENKLLTGAGVDRMQTGMSHAFGKPIGRAARMKKGAILLTIKVNKSGVSAVQEGIKKSIPRLPGKYSIIIEKLK